MRKEFFVLLIVENSFQMTVDPKILQPKSSLSDKLVGDQKSDIGTKWFFQTVETEEGSVVSFKSFVGTLKY